MHRCGMWLACLGIAGSLTGCVSYDPWQVRRLSLGYNVERACSAQISVYEHRPPPTDRVRLIQWGYNIGPPLAPTPPLSPVFTPHHDMPQNALPAAPLPSPPPVPPPPQPIDGAGGRGWIPRQQASRSVEPVAEPVHRFPDTPQAPPDTGWLFARQ